MGNIIALHHGIMFFVILISIFTSWALFVTVFFFYDNARLSSSNTHNTELEITWTVISGLILITIAFPFFGLLYQIDQLVKLSDVIIESIGNQRYLTYD